MPVSGWCERGNSNPHPLWDQILSLARLPIPPLWRQPIIISHRRKRGRSTRRPRHFLTGTHAYSIRLSSAARSPYIYISTAGLIGALAALVVLHINVLRLPYFWDEAGSYIPAALALILGAGWAAAQKQPAAHQPSSVAWKAPAEANPDQYVGGELCAGCHADQARQFGRTVHATPGVEVAQYGTCCESCHGPGKAHSDALMEGREEEGKKLIPELVFWPPVG